MKKFSLLILGILIGGFATYFLVPNSGESQIQAPDASAKSFMAQIAAPKGLITPDEAKALDGAFNDRHALISESIVKRPDNRSAWWSLEDMQNYLKYAENESKELGYTMDGVRVYLGAYPTEKEVGYTTMFIVPTGHKNLSRGSSAFFNMAAPGGDIPGGSGLNKGEPGMPPLANYPQ
ncbi:hypothetical protein [Xanthomarina sp.]|uniref:hypothetical protein n=1 Tax=Xanthomarina sp. TaxID=1931211 RepID=UPI002B8FFA53|nr:hypothetical protein [Xanthomarina sp.]HLV39657.1 hypothetical protein [Xanthomarina sp.]